MSFFLGIEMMWICLGSGNGCQSSILKVYYVIVWQQASSVHVDVEDSYEEEHWAPNRMTPHLLERVKYLH